MTVARKTANQNTVCLEILHGFYLAILQFPNYQKFLEFTSSLVVYKAYSNSLLSRTRLYEAPLNLIMD